MRCLQSFFQATGYYPRSLKDMFKHSKKKMIGQQHSGLGTCHDSTRLVDFIVGNVGNDLVVLFTDDSKNIIRIMSHLASKRYIFEETDRLDDSRNKIEEPGAEKFEISPEL